MSYVVHSIGPPSLEETVVFIVNTKKQLCASHIKKPCKLVKEKTFTSN